MADTVVAMATCHGESLTSKNGGITVKTRGTKWLVQEDETEFCFLSSFTSGTKLSIQDKMPRA